MSGYRLKIIGRYILSFSTDVNQFTSSLYYLVGRALGYALNKEGDICRIMEGGPEASKSVIEGDGKCETSLSNPIHRTEDSLHTIFN